MIIVVKHNTQYTTTYCIWFCRHKQAKAKPLNTYLKDKKKNKD